MHHKFSSGGQVGCHESRRWGVSDLVVTSPVGDTDGTCRVETDVGVRVRSVPSRPFP